MALVEVEGAVVARGRWVVAALPWCLVVGEAGRCCEQAGEGEGERLVQWNGHGWVALGPLGGAVVVRLRMRFLD